jgi:mRNA degradation ribonuclease J1/J2
VCEPFDLEMELDLKKVENWLAHFGLYPYTHIHASGHLNYDEIRDVVQAVQPKVLIRCTRSTLKCFRPSTIICSFQKKGSRSASKSCDSMVPV